MKLQGNSLHDSRMTPIVFRSKCEGHGFIFDMQAFFCSVDSFFFSNCDPWNIRAPTIKVV